MKRLAKLQASSTSASASPSTSSPAPSPPAPSPKPKLPAEASTPQTHVPPRKKAHIAPSSFYYDIWENETIGQVFQVTLDPAEAMKNEFEYVWLKSAVESEPSDGTPACNLRLTSDNLESVVITRLELDPQSPDYDDEYRVFLSKVPTDQTVFEYLVGCWKRLNIAKSALLKKGHPPVSIQKALELEERMRHLIISYIGINFQAPDAFYSPAGKNVGPQELVKVLLSLSALSTGMYGGSTLAPNSLGDYDIPQLLQDFVHRFDSEDGLVEVLGPVVIGLLFHPSLFREEGLAASDPQWRGVLTGLEALVAQKQIAIMITKMDEWNPVDATAVTFETTSLMGPLLRLNVFSREWPYITKISLRGTLKSLQSTMFQIFNSIVRASPESREAVLAYFSRVISLNLRRTGLRVDPATVATDSFMTNVHLIVLRFAEPFMDAQYTKMDRIDPHYYAHTSRIDLKDETRISATSEEATQWENAHRLAADLSKEHDEVQRHLDNITADNTWMGKVVQDDIDKIQAAQMSGLTQLYDPEFLFRSNTFTSFVTVWLIRYADPRKTHPKPIVELPLPKEVPLDFRILPEHILEDVIDYLFFAVRGPDLHAYVMLSTWWIKNPFLKNKIIDILFCSCYTYRGQSSLLGSLLNSHPVALKYLMPALTHFYIEVEQTGASSQFYDKFTHREALKRETQNIDKFVRFVNMMINDVTYLMDESLSELAQINNIQQEMANQAAWVPFHSSNALGTPGNFIHATWQLNHNRPVAAMLDYNLDALVGPRCNDLHVKNKEKYHFNPRQLLSDVVQERLFEHAAKICSKNSLKSPAEIEELMSFVDKVEEAKATLEAEEDLGEIRTNSSVHPLMFTVMRDPVILPISRTVIDRSTIKSHLLSDAKDPFNRTPLTIEEVVPDPELKERIEAFLTERRRKAASGSAEGEVTKMNVD
ncbi:ubiquitin elongating factor core-domain-containing protein [Russula vinacea]|nr:ubiquitin elongating factor core-domain-containing protein [Russula vinacea]